MQNDEKFLVRINFKNTADEEHLRKINLEIVNEKKGEYIEARLTWNEIFKMLSQNFDVNFIIEHFESELIDSAYHDYEELQTCLDGFEKTYPSICYLTNIGRTTTLNLPLQVVKISDHPRKEEDEPKILITGGHHAREPLSVEICLHLIKELCSNYSQNSEIKKWVDNFEIWFLPLVNPDGFSLIFDRSKNLTWWRKNLRDNNQNGIFDPEADGVDLNRNYDFNWDLGGGDEFSSQYYRGKFPFSENETQAIKNLAEDKRFTLVIDFHSYGEAILYPWSNQEPPVDLPLIREIAGEMASRIKKVNSIESYEITPLDAKMGQSSIWHFGKLGILGYIFETGDSYYPSGFKISEIAANNAKAIWYAFDRISRARLTGHIFDSETRKPLAAEIQIVNSEGQALTSLQTDAVWGRFDRILYPGIYELKVTASGFQKRILREIKVTAAKPTNVKIYLKPELNSEKTKP